jgi:hypothetical protein
MHRQTNIPIGPLGASQSMADRRVLFAPVLRLVQPLQKKEQEIRGSGQNAPMTGPYGRVGGE